MPKSRSQTQQPNSGKSPKRSLNDSSTGFVCDSTVDKVSGGFLTGFECDSMVGKLSGFTIDFSTGFGRDSTVGEVTQTLTQR